MRSENVEGKPVSASAMTTVRLMMPADANIVGNVFGGAIMRYMDEIAAIVAFKHARSVVVTASIDRMNFWRPVYVGNLLILKCSVNYVGRTSMEVGVRLEAEDLLNKTVSYAGSCYLTYVALDQNGHPTPIPPVIPRTRDQKRRLIEAMKRRSRREAEQRSKRV